MRFALAAVAALLFAGPATSAFPESRIPPRCQGHDHPATEQRTLARQVFKLSRWENPEPGPGAKKTMRRLRSCAAPSVRKEMREDWRKMKRQLYRHREQKLYEAKIDAVTPYGNWAIPEYIVMCESGGDFSAYNSSYEPTGPGSGPGGAYQIILQTWNSYGGAAFASSASVSSELGQHIVAGRVWNDVGTSAWACA